MATESSQVRGLKGTITKLKEQVLGLEQMLEDANRYAEGVLEEKNDLAQRYAVAEREMQRADNAARAHEARAEQLKEELSRSRKIEEEVLRLLKVAELERARLNGYIQRVAEDDAVREGNADVADTRSVPRRPAPPLSQGPDYGSSYNTASDNSGGIDLSRGYRRY